MLKINGSNDVEAGVGRGRFFEHTCQTTDKSAAKPTRTGVGRGRFTKILRYDKRFRVNLPVQESGVGETKKTKKKNYLRLTTYDLRLLLLPIALLFSCTQPNANRTTPGTEDKPRVVATSTVINDLAERVGGEEIQLRGILKPGDDPHVYEPVPADSQVLEDADLILYNGYNLEPGLIKLMNAAGLKGQKLAVGEVVKPLQLDKGRGEVVPDPHVWGDVENSIQMVNRIRDALIELSPEDKEKFTQNAAKLIAQLQQLDTWMTQQIQTIPAERQKLITTHDAFQYFGRAYGLAIAGTLIGISTEEQPSAQTVQKLVEAVKKAGVPTIFAETTINPALITTVAQEAGVKLAPRQLYSDSIGAAGSNGDSYIKMMAANTQTIVEALGGKYVPFEGAK